MNILRIAVRFLAPLLAVGLGIGALVFFVETKPQAARQERVDSAPLVEVVDARPERERVVVSAMGTVIPAREMVVMPEVSGVVVEHHPELVRGGTVAEGETLVRIDARDYEMAVEQRQAEVARARLELRLEEGRARVAKREWDSLKESLPGDSGEASRDLALRDPQIRAARSALAAARSAVRQARLGVERTTLEAPFDAYVKREAVEVGQWVGPQSQIATLVGTNTFWVEASVPVDRLRWIAVPGRGVPEGEGASATVVHQAGAGARIERRGRVIRLLSDLEPRARMARLLVAIDDPLGLDSDDPAAAPLLLGAYVEVELDGGAVEGMTPVPRVALRDGDEVWIADGEGRLRIRPVEVAWRASTQVLVSEGLEPGERIITSPLSAPVPGMRVRIAEARAADGGSASEPAEVPTPAAASVQ